MNISITKKKQILNKHWNACRLLKLSIKTLLNLIVTLMLPIKMIVTHTHTHTQTWSEQDLGRGHVNRYYDDDHLLTTVLIRDECVCMCDGCMKRFSTCIFGLCVREYVCVRLGLGELHCYMAVRRRFNTYPVRRSCGVEGGVQGELASLNELPSDAHWRFLTACSKFSVERLRLGLIVCKGWWNKYMIYLR